MLPAKVDYSEIRDLEGRIGAYVNLIKVIRTERENTEFVERSIAASRAAIAYHEKIIADLLDRVERGPQIIEETQVTIKQLGAKLAAMKHVRAIEEMKRLYAEMQTLGGNVLDGSNGEERDNDDISADPDDAPDESDIDALMREGGLE